MLPPNTYKVDDFETIRQTIFDDALNSLSNRFPLENDKYRLTVEDLGYDSIPKYTTLQQKEAVQSDKTLSAKIKGRWTLYDKNTGKIVSQSSRKTIMDVPYMTERGTFIRNGTEMTLPIQMRLVPGVYARMTDSGEAKAHINVKPGSGSQLSITMNPANPVFKVTQGTRNYKLYPLLKHMGISDEYLMNAWGKDIYKANYDDFISGGGWYSAKTAAEENPYDEITKRVFRGDLDPLETEASLGKGYKTVDPDMMVAAASKLLRISKGEAESDNRDSLENQRFLMAPELIGERVRLDAGKVGQTLLWKISRSGDVNKIPAGALNKYINGLFTESRLAQAIEETNPLDAYMRATKVTRMGEGGISGVDTAPMSARLVHNTYKGFIDPTVSPECCANHLVMSNLGWIEISKVTEDTLIACLIDGKLEYHKPYKVVSYDFNGELYCYNAKATAYEVTGNHRMWSRLDAFSDYTFEFAENIFNTHRIFWSGADTYTDDSKTEITIFANTPDETYHFKKPYVGKVYCLSVPGGLFYTKLPGKRPFWIGNSLRAGLDSAIALNAVKGKDGFMYTPMINAISGRREYVNSLVASKVPVAFSEYRDSTQKYIPAMVGNKIEYLPKANVKYFIPNGDSLFALSSNLIPLKSGIKAGRLLMAQKHQTQAVSLSSRMAPYVQTEHPGDNTISVEKSIGKLMGAVFSKGDGKVLSVTPDEMTVRYNDGTKETISLYNNYPLNRKSVSGNTSVVILRDGYIKRIKIKDYVFNLGDKVQSVNPYTGRSSWMPISGFEKLPCDKKLYKVTYRSGRSVVVTEDHSLITLDKGKYLVPILPSDVIIGETRSPIAKVERPDSIIQYNKYMATFLGLYLAEGYICPNNRTVCIAVKDPDRSSEVLELINNISPSINAYINGKNVVFTNSDIALECMRVCGRYSDKKFISSDIFNWDIDAIKCFIQGYFAGDGCFHTDRNGVINMCAVSVSAELRDALVDLLSMFNIRSTIFYRKLSEHHDTWNDAYGLRVKNSDINNLEKWFFYSDRNNKLKPYLKDNYRSSWLDNVPLINMTRRDKKELYASIECINPFYYKSINTNKSLSKSRLCNSSIYDFNKWANSDVLWDIIIGIEESPHEEYVYDFCVDTAEAFCVNNGLLVHNTFFNNDARVKPGDIIKKGQVLASSNYTDENGVSALGTQLRTAWMPFKGENYLDAIIVSEDAAKKLSSEHLYHTGVDKDSTTTIDKNAYTSAFPTKFNKDQLATIDKDGIVKPGTTVKFGDPLILSYSKREATPGSLHRALVKDNVVTWEHEFPGYITDVVNSSKGVKVYTKAYLPLQTGDKCFSDDTDLLTNTGWKNIKDITLNDKIATLNPETNCFEYLYPDSLHKIPYNGPMYTIDTSQLKTCVTPYHNNFVQKRYSDHFELVKASDCFNKRVSFKKDGIWNGVDTPTFTWPTGTKVDMDSVLILLGLFIAGESITLDNSVYNYLNTYRDHIPAFIFDLSIRQQKLFFDCLLNKKGIFTTKYKQLADDIQRLCLHIGLTATIKAGSIYRVIISHNTTPIVNSAIYTNYNGYVYCPTMPKWNVVYSRRNGVPVWSGNCAARYANKGVTARVVPTSEMPIAADGKPIDVIFGPTGIVSRVNSAQLVEAMLGKVAAKTGKRYVLPGFMNENMVEFAKRELEQAGLTDREDLTDPTTGITIPQITVGNSYIVKMHHTAESKGGARATGAYTMDELPGGQGHDGSKLLGNLILGAIIGHGCFVGSTNILTDRGYMEIGNIVKRRLPVNVYSYNKETDSFEYRPVTNWFVYTVDDSDMWEIHTTARSGIESTKGRGIAGSHRAIHCTKDHKFYTLDRGLVEASKLVEGDTVLTIGDSITDWQKQIIYGTLMGDGYSLRGTLRITHGPKQLAYNEWLYSKLRTFCNSSPIIKEQKSGFGKSIQSRLVTRSVGWISQIANEFYHTNKKTVPSDIITKMGWPGIGIWFADDGSCGNHKGKTHSYNFHTCAFTIQECELLISALNEFTGLIWSLVLKSGKYPVIRLNTRSIKDDQLSKFAKMIAPYLPPGFEYKLGDRYTSDLNYGLFWTDKVPSDHIDKPEICFVKKSAPYIRPDYDTSLVYDITVEHNHNFIAAGVLVSNSTEVLKDMKLVKGQKNTDFWRDFKLGRTPVMPSTPLIYDKFIASLQGAGINVHKEKNTTNIFALTNKDINDFAHAEVKNSDTYSANNMAPLPGGLFDPNIFGPNGTQWGYIKLDEPVLNPVMEDPIKLILGLTEADLEAVISGNKKLPNGLTGGLGLKRQLESINMKQAVQDALNDVKNATRTKRDKAVKKYRYLSSMLKHNAGPADFMLDKIPVIPPRFRRISQSGDLTMVADANYLYRALMDNQQDVRDARNAGLPEDMVGSGNLKIYKAFKAITGLSDPEDRKLQEKQISGLLKWVFGKGSPKCYDSETEILTENGWVKFPEYLDSTIKVATLNPSTDAFEWQTPTDIIHMPYSGDMIYTHTRYLDSMVTPNHNHYVSLRTGKGINSRWTPFAKEQASNLVDVVKRVRYKTAASKYIGSTPNTFDITPNANAFATFIGWYTAEGWIHTDNTIAYIAVKAHGRDESILTDLFDNNAFKYKRAYYTTKAAKVSPYGIKTPAGYEMVYFSFYSKELCQWLRENVGASCYTKRLSSEILGWSSEYLINVWEGFHAGDGEKRSGLITTNSKKTWQSRKSFTDRGNRACTVSKDLAESFVELGLKIGASVNYVKNKEVYRISVHAFDYSVAEYRHQTSKVPYDGMVHCVTVPNGLVFVRRNGRVLVSGNSGAYQRNVVGGSLDVAGRNVITPNASFRLDEIGLPKKEAWTLYQDFVIRRLVQNGMDPLVATKEVTNKTKLAEDALRQVVSERPVLATRAPALHKYSIMAFRPRLVESETLQLNPAIQKPFNADHDGDDQVGRVVIRFTQKIELPFKYTLEF